MALNAGSAYVSVRPDLRGFHTALKNDLKKMEQSFQASVAKGIKAGQREGFSVATLTPYMTRVEKNTAKAVSKGVRDGMRDGFSRSVDMHTARFEKKISTSLGKALSGAFKSADFGDLGGTIEKSVQRGLKDGVRVTVDVRAAQKEGDKAGKEAASKFASAFDKTVRTRLAAASRALPDINLDADSSALDHKLAEVQAKLLSLNSKKVGVDIDAARAMAEVRRIESALNTLSRRHPNIQVRADTLAAAAQLRAIKSAADEAGGSIQNFGKRIQGTNLSDWLNRTSLTFGQMLGLATSFGTVAIPILGTAAVGAAGLASAMVAAGGAFAAFAAVATISLTRVLQAQEELKQLNEQHINVVNAVKSAQQGLADAQRGVAQAQADAARSVADAQRNVRDAVDAVAEAEQDAAAAIEDARRAVRDAHADAAESVRDAEQAVQEALRGVDDAMRGVADAQRALSDARRNAADAAVQANDDVRASEEQLVSSQNDVLAALEALHAAREQAKADLDELAEKTRDNALAEEGSALALQRARDALAQAEQSGTATQLDLAEARHAVAVAEDALSDQRNQSAADLQKLANAERLGIEGSEGVRSARERLAEAEREVAEAQADTAKAREDAARARGQAARQVADAQRALADARRGVAEAERNVADAQRRLAEARRDGAANVADAQRRLADVRADGAEAVRDANQQVADSQRAVTDARRQGNQAVADAQRQVTAAQRSLSSAQKALAVHERARAEALAKMGTGAGIALAGVERLKRAFQRFLNSVQPVVFRNLVKGMDALRPLMRALTPLVKVGARLFGDFAQRAAKAFRGEHFNKFIGWMVRMSRAVGPDLMKIVFRLTRAFLNLVRAFGPVGKDVVKGLARMTGQFARWTAGLRKNKEFQAFIAYAREMAPHVLEFFGAFIQFAVRLVKALAPIGTIMLHALTAFFKLIDRIPIPVLTVAIGGLSLAVAAFKGILLIAAGALKVWRLGLLLGRGVMLAWRGALLAARGAMIVARGAMLLLNLAFRANPIGLVITILGLLVAGLVWAYKKFDWFRNLVDSVWDALVKGARWLYDVLFGHSIFPDLLDAFRKVFDAIGKVVNWLYDNVIKPVFKLISTYITDIWWPVVKGIFNAIVWVLKKTVFPVIEWLWGKVVKPVFGWIGDKIENVWDNVIKPVFQKLGDFIKETVAPAFRKGVDLIGSAWDRIKQLAAKPVNFVLGTVYNDGIRKAVNWVMEKLGADMRLPKVPLVSWGGSEPRATPGAGSTAPGITKAATGGVLPGYTPGRDVHHFRSPTGGRLHLSGGEAIMRPEWTRMVGGPRTVARMNEAARRGRMQYASGGVVWPVPGRDVSTYSGHDGVDINRGSGADDFGDLIRAFRDGTISYVGTARGYGNAIFQRGPGYPEVVYGHTSRQAVRKGQRVKAGQVIGAVGNSGNSSAPHLHFGHPGGTYDQAMALLAGAKGEEGWLSKAWSWVKDQGSRLYDWALGKLRDIGSNWISKIPGAGIFGQIGKASLSRVVEAATTWVKQNFTGDTGTDAKAYGADASGIFKSLMSTGFYDKKQAAGVMGNMMIESGLDPFVVQGGGHAATPKGIGSGWGLVQWTPGTKVLPYLKGGTGVAQQISALTAQLRGQGSSPESYAGQKLRATRTVDEATQAFGQYYERPADLGSTIAQRQAYGRLFFERFAANGGVFDRGGWLKAGGVAINKSRKPEPVFTNKQWHVLKDAINALTLQNGARVTPSFLMDYMPKLPKTVQRLHSEFQRARDALRGFRERTERARDALRDITRTRRYRRANRRLGRAQAAFGDTMKLSDIRDDMRVARNERARALKRAGRTPMGRDALKDWRKANRQLKDRRSVDELAAAEERLKWKRSEADSKAERERIDKRLEALGKERKETEKLLKQRRNAARQSDAVQELENATARIELLRGERRERKKAARELKQARNVPVIQRAEKAEDRLNKRLNEQAKAMDRAKQAAARYRAAQEKAIARAKEIFGKGMELGTIENAPWKTSGGILYNLRRAFRAVTQWTDVVKQLKVEGLRGPIMDEFINAGPSAEAVRTGRSLLASGQITEINRMQDELRKASMRAGTVAAAPLNRRRPPQVRQAQAVRLDKNAAARANAHVHYHGMPADTVNTIVNKTVARLNHQMARQGV